MHVKQVLKIIVQRRKGEIQNITKEKVANKTHKHVCIDTLEKEPN